MHTIGSDNLVARPAPARIRVLIVDDQLTMRRIIRRSLRKIGITDVYPAENGAAALEWLSFPSNPQPDVIICDLHMDTMDGLEFAHAVRRGNSGGNSGPDKTIPILLLTGESDRMLLDVAQQVGVTNVLHKPISPQGLGEAIGHALGYQLDDPN